jgi:predicted enzyme related to lactoylglutathione lyase
MSTMVNIDITVDNLERANDFYLKLFGRKMEKVTDAADGPSKDTRNRESDKGITAYVGVHSIEEYIEKVEALGGKALTPKMVVQGWGYLVICMDTANNIFNLWESTLMSNNQPEWVSIIP